MNFKGKVAVGLLCAILGFIISLQFNTVKNVTNKNFLSIPKVQQLASELRSLREEKEKLNGELNNLEKQLKAYERYEVEENLIIKNLIKNLEKHQLMAGYKAGEGPGVIVTIDKPQSNSITREEDSSIMYSDKIIMQIINILNVAGAEAIAINDQRYISTTEIFPTSNALLIKSVLTRQPFIIKAIGNPETLEEALNIRYGIIWELRNDWNLDITVSRYNDIIMPRYSKLIEYEYAKPIELIQ